ncbi:MAG: metalloprotease TldD [Ahniella sp.]|nr:metalloprotease TldD [Ahniella sp.]
MTDVIHIAERRLLTPTGLSVDDLDRVFAQLLGPGIDAGDLYFQHSRHESWVLEDGIVKEGTHSIEQGVGVRAITGEKTGFAYTDDLVLPALMEAASSARAISKAGQDGRRQSLMRRQADRAPLYAAEDPVESIPVERKVALLREIDAFARSIDPRVRQVVVSLSAVADTILLAHSDGTFAADVRPLVRFNVQVIVESNGRREQASAGGGGRMSYADLLNSDFAQRQAREAVRQALVNLEAVDAPAGEMPVVLGPGWPGVLLHEAVGHGLEGDFNRKGLSAFSGPIGEQVTSPLCTVVDDGTLASRRGSLNVDDEGTPTRCTTLIENGRLVGYMQDKHNAGLMDTAPTGNARRESFAHLPMPRMTNTYLQPGDSDPNDIIASVDRGIYAVNFGGGQVDITSGKFVFSASEAYLIEGGKVTRPVKGATLVGSGPEVMQRIVMLGNDLKLDAGVGICGKDGQSVPVGVGQPTLKISAMTVGGTQAG